MDRNPHQKVIEDFGRQWTTYTNNSGFYGSQELFKDILEPLVPCRMSAVSVLPKSELGQAEYPPCSAKPEQPRLLR